ncbi:MAG: hypothetical protein ACE5IJ_10850 [Thermoplasmata archaeon]
MNQERNLAQYVILSAVGASLIIVISWLGASDAVSFDAADKLLVGGAFILSCMFGISIALRPGWVSRSGRRNHGAITRGQTGKGKRRGHHPDCGGFEAHVIDTKSRSLCAGCTGLAVGSIISILLVTVCISLPARIPPTFLYVLVSLGMFLIAVNFAETVIPVRNAVLHLVSNVFLVISFFFIVIGVFLLTGNAVYGILGIVMSFLWLETRIRLSNWRHAEVCGECSETCKAY